MYLNALPSLSPADIMVKIKGVTSKTMRVEFPHLRHFSSLWTRSYFVSTAWNVTSETINVMLINKKLGGEIVTQIITVNIKLLPTKEQAMILREMSKEYISTINTLVSEMIAEKKSTSKSSKDLSVHLPSAVKNQAIIDAKSVFRKAKKNVVPVLKKPVCIWNNQNYTFDSLNISLPIMVDGKAKKIPIRALLIDKKNRNLDLLNYKLGTLRITQKSGKWIAQIAVKMLTKEETGRKVMGVDLGLKVPAVAVTDDERVRFFGNGRQNKYKKRKFRSERKTLGKKKKLNAIRNSEDKEQRWMKDQDHKVSRAIVNFAKENNISVIHLEQLANIRQTARTSRKNEKNLHTWSFYRVSQFVAYKAKIAGIKVEYVKPAYTSQTCPKCSEKNKAQDRIYTCACGFKKHRDIVGAMNIRYAPVVGGHSQSA